MSDVERVERLLRSALMPVEPSELLSDRLERSFSELTEAAAEELADWELATRATGCPPRQRSWSAPRPPAGSCSCARVSSSASGT